MNITPKEISERLWLQVEKVAKHLLPNGKRQSNEWCVGSADGEEGQSLRVNLGGKKKWHDFASGEGGDLLDLWCLTKSCGLHTAIKEAKAFLGIADDDAVFQKQAKKFKTPERKGIRSTKSHIEYLAKRGISKETCEAFKISDADVFNHKDKTNLNGMAFPYIRDGELKLIKKVAFDRPEGKKVINASADSEPCLFGWQTMPNDMRICIICEGEIDAMSFYEYGLPAFSVPFGGGKGAKQQWIDYEFHNLDRFEEIILCLDTDEAGQEAAKEISQRLGVERCRMAKLPFKDANECLMNGIGEDEMLSILEQATFFDPEELANAGSFREQTKHAFYGEDPYLFESSWKRLNGDFKFRESEISIVNGVNGHGKSQVVGQMMLDAMTQGVRCCAASMEIKPQILLKRLTRQSLCTQMPTPNDVDLAFDFYAQNLWLFTLTGTAKSDRLLEVMKYAVRRYGIQLFVIDSLMKCGIGEDDYTGQKIFLDKLCDFKNKYNCHVILVTHSRKAESEDKPTGKMDVKGSSSITDLVDNVFIIWRNKIRERAIQAMNSGEQPDQKEQAYVSMPGAILLLDKQRNGEGWEGKVGLYFDQQSNQYKEEESGSPYNYIARKSEEEIERDAYRPVC